MPAYRYEAADARGRIERGLIDADSSRHAGQTLRARGLWPLSVKLATEAAAPRSAILKGPRITDAELCGLTRQLASLLTAGLPLDTALSATLEQAGRRHVTNTLASVRADVRAGHRLGQALAAHPRDFPPIYRSLVDAGEDSGRLPLVMEKLAEYIESRSALRNKILTAFIYPLMVTLVSIAIVVFLLTYVVPQVVGAFNQAHQTLPLLTRLLLALSDGVRQWGVPGGFVLAALFAAWCSGLRHPRFRLAWHAWLLRVPVLGRYIVGVNTARYAATLAILTSGGVPLLAALAAAARTLSNDHLRCAAEAVTRQVREGSSLGHALQAQQVFPPLLIYLVGSGERTGALPAMLDRACTTLSGELERRALTTTALLEPLVILSMGGIVLVIVLAIMMPIIEINQLIQ